MPADARRAAIEARRAATGAWPPPSLAAEVIDGSSLRFEDLLSVELQEAQSVLASHHQNVLRIAARNQEVTHRLENEVARLKAENSSLNDKALEWNDFWESFTVSPEDTLVSESNCAVFASVSTPSKAECAPPEDNRTANTVRNIAALKSNLDAYRDLEVLCEQKPVTTPEPSEPITPDEKPSGTPREHAQNGRRSAGPPRSALAGNRPAGNRPSAVKDTEDQEILDNDPNRITSNSKLLERPGVIKKYSSAKRGLSFKEGDVDAVLLPVDLASEAEEDQDDDHRRESARMSRASCFSDLSRLDDMETFEVAQVWNQAKVNSGVGPAMNRKIFDTQKSQGGANQSRRLHAVNTTTIEHLRMAETEGYLYDKCGFTCVIHPHSTQRLAWDLLSLAVVWYDLVFVPLQFFDPPQWGFLYWMSWITRVFWTFDVAASFTSGFIRNDGAVEMRLRKIARRYCMTWLALDLVLVLADWSEVFIKSSSDAGHGDAASSFRLGKATRIFRMIRMIRLLRIARIRLVFKNLTDRLHSERLIIVADIMKIVIIIAGVAHLVACFWYGLSAGQDDKVAWIWAKGYDDKALGYRYATSLHWSLSQFAGGMDEITPECIEERIYAICAFMMAFVMAAVSISAITSSMTQLHIIGSTQSQQLSVLRRYLARNGISNTLSMRVQRNAKHALIEQHRFMSEGSVELLRMVSEPLRAELHFETYSPILSFHPFLRKYIEDCPQVMRKVCHFAVSLSLLSPGDILFHAGEVPAEPKMFIVCDGLLNYSSLGGNRAVVGEGTCISEATLWTDWCYRGVLSAVTECRLLMLDAQSFQGIATRFEHIETDPASYARSFVQRLNEDGMDVDDVTTPVKEKHCDDKHALSTQGNRWRFGSMMGVGTHVHDDH